MWFNDPLDHQALGLIDYLQVVKKPMDLRTAREKLERREYKSRNECIADIRLIWSNALLYNTIGTKVYSAAVRMSEQFEMLCMPEAHERMPTEFELHNFVETCWKLPAEELGRILMLLDKVCPQCLVKKPSNEVDVNTDLLTAFAFFEVSKVLQTLTLDTKKTSISKGGKIENDRDGISNKGSNNKRAKLS